MHRVRVAIHRWGWAVAALIALTAVTELRPQPPRLQPMPAQYTVLDHVPLRRAMLGSETGTATPGRAPTLTVRGERPYYFGHTVGGIPPLPPWLEPHHGADPVTTFHGELDGSSLAIADTTVILIDRDRRADIGLDFRWFRMFPPELRHPESADALVTIVEAHRVGSRLIVYGTDPEGGAFLASLDIATGLSTWITQVRSDSVTGFAVTHDVAVTSEFVGDHPALVVRELARGTVVAEVPTKDGTYTLETRPDGSLHGVIEALAEDGYTSEIDVAVN